MRSVVVKARGRIVWDWLARRRIDPVTPRRGGLELAPGVRLEHLDAGELLDSNPELTLSVDLERAGIDGGVLDAIAPALEVARAATGELLERADRVDVTAVS